MRFSTYAAALAFVTDGIGNRPYTVEELPHSTPNLRDIHDACIGDISPEEQNWIHEAYNQSGDKPLVDTTLEVMEGGEVVGRILVWTDADGYTERCYTRCYVYRA